MNRLFFYLNALFFVLNLMSFLSTGSVISLLVCAVNGYCAYTLKHYA